MLRWQYWHPFVRKSTAARPSSFGRCFSEILDKSRRSARRRLLGGCKLQTTSDWACALFKSPTPTDDCVERDATAHYCDWQPSGAKTACFKNQTNVGLQDHVTNHCSSPLLPHVGVQDHVTNHCSSPLSFFLEFRRPNLITGLSGWRTLSEAALYAIRDTLGNLLNTLIRQYALPSCVSTDSKGLL